MPLPPGTPQPQVDFADLYDAHPEYEARRRGDSFERAQIDIEVRQFKLPNLLALLGGQPPLSMLEIGCATGELTAAFPVVDGGWRLGVDISAQNVAAARQRFPDLRFEAGDFRAMQLPLAEVVLLSDVLEHVPDDAAFLAQAARCGRRVLLNLPLEDNWLNRGRAYGPSDVSGHLRAYSLADGLDLVGRAGLRTTRWQQVWIHESPVEAARRDLRKAQCGQAYAGGRFGQAVRRSVFGVASAVRPLGRRLFASNLFALVESS
jgi:SAM-dependent methyltransferase